jgi:hypothetical protein
MSVKYFINGEEILDNYSSFEDAYMAQKETEEKHET